MEKEIFMEDVRNIALEAHELIVERLKEFNIIMTDVEDDKIYVQLVNNLEQIANYPDYRSYN